MTFYKIKGIALFIGFSFIYNRHFLPFERADLTTCALVKLFSRAKRGDLIIFRQQHEIAAPVPSKSKESTSFLATTSK